MRFSSLHIFFFIFYHVIGITFWSQHAVPSFRKIIGLKGPMIFPDSSYVNSQNVLCIKFSTIELFTVFWYLSLCVCLSVYLSVFYLFIFHSQVLTPIAPRSHDDTCSTMFSNFQRWTKFFSRGKYPEYFNIYGIQKNKITQYTFFFLNFYKNLH